MCILLFALFECSAHAAEATVPRVTDDRLQLTLFAANPKIVTPIGVACDRRGRVFVLESHTHMPPSGYQGPKYDRVKVLEDTVGDGRADSVRVFADKINQGMNLAFSPDGTLHIVTAKQVIALADDNGDGMCDDGERRVLIRLETKQSYAHSQLLGLTFSHDGWMFVTRGNVAGFAYAWVGSDGRRIEGYGEGGGIVRCRADGSQIERFAQGFWNPFDVRFDRHGRLLCVDNDPDSRGPNRLLHIARGGDYGFRAFYGPTGLHPYDAWEGELPGTLPMIAGVGEAPSAVMDLSFSGLPEDYCDTIAVTVWGEHRVSLVRTERRGVSLAGKAEPWIGGGKEFRPVGLTASPDGSVYITDWVLQDYPNHGCGAVWRLSAKPSVRTTQPFDPYTEPSKDDGIAKLTMLESTAAVERITTALDDDDPFVRSAAVFALSRPTMKDAALRMWEAESAGVRLGALLALKRANLPAPRAILSEALRDRDEDIQITALMWIGDRVLKDLSGELDLLIAGDSVSPRLFELWLATKEILTSDVEAAYQRQQRGFDIKRELPASLVESIVRDESRSAALRALALPRLANVNDPSVRELLVRLVERSDGSLQREAIRSLATNAHADTGQLLRSMALDKSRSAEIRADALAALSHQPQQLTVELLPLLNDSDHGVAVQAARSFRSIALEPNIAKALSEAANRTQNVVVEVRPTTLEEWQQKLATGGDPTAGERLFHTAGITCIQCHRVRNRGGTIGPELSVVARTADRSRLIHSLVQPSDEIAPQFQGWMVVTIDGKIITGLQGHLRTGGAVSIIDTEGRTRSIPGDQVEEFVAMKKSLMPDDLTRTMPITDLQDLVAWLETLQ
jgi:putative membrane-bound dehydrogenase-like protein